MRHIVVERVEVICSLYIRRNDKILNNIKIPLHPSIPPVSLRVGRENDHLSPVIFSQMSIKKEILRDAEMYVYKYFQYDTVQRS